MNRRINSPQAGGIQRRLMGACAALSVVCACLAAAQTPAVDPSTRLREVLPADVAERVLTTISTARSQELPAEALQNRALKFAARGIPPLDIERSITEQVERMGLARGLIVGVREGKAESDEIEAGAEALRMGVDGSAVSTLAKSAPSGRSLAVPLFVIGSLVDRGLPSDAALQRVLQRLQARASDAELEQLPQQAAAQGVRGQHGRDNAAAKRPEGAGAAGGAGAGRGGRPASVPANVGKGAEKGKGNIP